MNKLFYRVTHPFDDHKIGDRLETVDEARVASNHVVPVATDEGNGADAPKNTKVPDGELAAVSSKLDKEPKA